MIAGVHWSGEVEIDKVVLGRVDMGFVCFPPAASVAQCHIAPITVIVSSFTKPYFWGLTCIKESKKNVFNNSDIYILSQHIQEQILISFHHVTAECIQHLGFVLHGDVKYVTRGFSSERAEQSGRPAVISILFSAVI